MKEELDEIGGARGDGDNLTGRFLLEKKACLPQPEFRIIINKIK